MVGVARKLTAAVRGAWITSSFEKGGEKILLGRHLSRARLLGGPSARLVLLAGRLL